MSDLSGGFGALGGFEAGDYSSNPVGCGLGKNLGPVIDGLHGLVAHGLGCFYGSSAEQIDSGLFIHGLIVNQFTRLSSN